MEKYLLTITFKGYIIIKELPLTVIKEVNIMARNLIAELIKIGINPREVTKKLASTLGISEKSVRNKLNGTTQWTLPEAVKINNKLFGGKKSIEYLFMSDGDTTPTDKAG